MTLSNIFLSGHHLYIYVASFVCLFVRDRIFIIYSFSKWTSLYGLNQFYKTDCYNVMHHASCIIHHASCILEQSWHMRSWHMTSTIPLFYFSTFLLFYFSTFATTATTRATTADCGRGQGINIITITMIIVIVITSIISASVIRHAQGETNANPLLF